MPSSPARRPRPALAAATPFWTDRIVQGDAISVLHRLPPESVHLAVTSPPYNVGILYDGYADDRSYAGYLDWMKSVWRALMPALVPGGRFALNVAPTSI